MGVDHSDKFSFREVGENASIHGVRQLSLTYHHSKFVLVGWICIICVAFATICYQITMLINLILTYPSSVAISVSLEHTVFPTVTACNMGVYRKSVVENIDTFVEMSQTFTSVSSLQRSKREVTVDGQVTSVEESIRHKRQTPSNCSTACTAIGDFCYIVYNTLVTNYKAQSTCATVGGKLPSFSTAQQYDSYCAYQQTQLVDTRYWLGFWNYATHSDTNPGIWRDTNGTGSSLTYSNWCLLDPDDGKANANEKCASNRFWGTPPGCWIDIPCQTKSNPFMCMCQCPAISIARGTVVTNSQVSTLNYTAQFQCNSGYQLVGSPTLYCINSGGGMNWDQPTPTCVPITTTPTSTPATTTSTTSPTATTTTTPATTASTSTTTPITTTSASTTTPTTTTSTSTTTPTTETSTSTSTHTTTTSTTSTTPITTPTTTTIPTTPTTVGTVTLEVASLIPNVSTDEFTASLDVTAKNGTADNIAVAIQLNTAMEFVLSSVPPTELKQLGFQRNEFVPACLFSGMPCNNDEKLTLVQIPEFLNCYAFNHRDQTNLVTFERPGDKFGLSMSFNIQADEYINTMTTAGVQLFVQNQLDPILPGSMGTIYSPGLQYYIMLSKRIETQLSVPNRLCLSSTKENSFNIFKNDTYFTESCLRSYLQVKIISNCGCGSVKYPLPNDNSKFCNLTTSKCASDYLTSKGTKLIAEAQVVCPPACRSVSFDLSITFASLSPEVFVIFLIVFNFLFASCFQQQLLEHLNVTRTFYMKNIVMVKLFFTTGTIMVYTEALNFDVMSVLASIGGSVGCIAGISMISLVELFFVIAKVVKLVKYKCHNRQLR